MIRDAGFGLYPSGFYGKVERMNRIASKTCRKCPLNLRQRRRNEPLFGWVVG